MEEILELKEFLLKGDVKSALIIAEEIEEMSKKDIINNIRSFAIILLLHLIKQHAEKRTTKSWDVSIRNSVRDIQELNDRPKSKGFYLNSEELQTILIKAYSYALDKAALEVCEGIYDVSELAEIVNQDAIIATALNLILAPEN